MLNSTQVKKLQAIRDKILAIDENIKKSKENRKTMLTEITESVPEAEKQNILRDAEKDFAPAKEKHEQATRDYAIALAKYNATLNLLNYRIKQSNGKTSKQIILNDTDKTVSLTRNGKTFVYDIATIDDNKKLTVAIKNDFACGDSARSIAWQIRTQAAEKGWIKMNGNNHN